MDEIKFVRKLKTVNLWRFALTLAIPPFPYSLVIYHVPPTPLQPPPPKKKEGERETKGKEIKKISCVCCGLLLPIFPLGAPWHTKWTVIGKKNEVFLLCLFHLFMYLSRGVAFALGAIVVVFHVVIQ